MVAQAPMPPQQNQALPPPPPTAMQPAPGQYSQWGQNPTQVAPPPPPGGAIPMPPTGGQFSPIRAREDNFYGGQQIAGAAPSQADYGSVQGYADQAYQQARRNIDPLQEQQSRRTEQSLINKGIDPSSEQGKAMLDQQNRNFADQNAAASFGALQFGQGIQNQMSQQELANQQLAGNMQQGLWGQETARKGQDLQWQLGQMGDETSRYGMQLQNQLGQSGLANQRYGMDLNQQLGMGNLDYQRGMGEHTQMMDLLGYDMNVNQMNQQNQLIQDAMWMNMYNSTPIPQMGQLDPNSPANQYLGAGNTKWISGGAEGGTPW